MKETETQKSTTDYLINLMLLHAENQGLTKNYICEQSGVDLRKYERKGHKPSLKTIACYCRIMNLSVGSMIMVAEFAFIRQTPDSELVKWVTNWQRLQAGLNDCVELVIKKW